MGATWLWVALAAAGDKDGDSVSNKVDACLTEAEDVDGFEDADGCPDPDNDQDGRPDADDRCPDEPEDLDGHDDDDGCPDPDDDDDIVFDADDRCPEEREDGLGPADGCPDVSFDLLAKEGWMRSVGELMDGVLAAAGKQSAGCADGAAHVRGWLDAHDPALEQRVFEARLARRPEYLDEQTFRSLLEGRGSAYPNLRKALSIFCRDDAAWQGVAAPLDAVMAPWLPTP